MRLAKHYVREWERHSDLYVFPITAQDNLQAAHKVARLAAFRFHFIFPGVSKNMRRRRSTCRGCLTATGLPAHITLSTNFTAGELLHELAHAWCFYKYADHDHGQLFIQAMDDLCIWFRASEEAQRWLFP